MQHVLSPEIIQDFFLPNLEQHARLNILSKLMLICNVNETGVSIVHKPGKAVAKMGRRNVWSITSAEKGKTHTMSCASASGFVLPPLMIYSSYSSLCRSRFMINY